MLGQDLFRVLGFSYVIIIPTVLHTHVHLYYRYQKDKRRLDISQQVESVEIYLHFSLVCKRLKIPRVCQYLLWFCIIASQSFAFLSVDLCLFSILKIEL
jgi:hypothetical protein